MGNCSTCFKTSTSSISLNNQTLTGQHLQVVDPSRPVDHETIERCETDELLTPSPIHMTSICLDTISGNNKKSIILNGNTTSMNDIITAQTTIKDTQQVSDNTLNALFEEYKDSQEDAVLSEGIERLCIDLGYKPDDFAILVLAWRLDASQMCRFTKLEFIQGLQEMNADTILEIRKRLEQTIENMKNDSDMFKQLYRFTFRFGLESGNRILSLDMAIILWRLVFTIHTPDILNKWLYFLEQHPKIRGVPKDTWNMFLNFAETCDITSYDDTEAWPSLFDDFVEYENDHTNQNLSKNKNENDKSFSIIHLTSNTGYNL